MKKISILTLTGILCLFINITPSVSQEERKIELTAQAILARVDSAMGYPKGEIRGRIKHIYPTGKSFYFNFTAFISKEDFLFRLSNRTRGEQLKILYNMGGEDIWVYNLHAIKLYNKRGIDKYDSILSTNFNYLDLSNADLQSNYNAAITGKAIIRGLDAYKLKLKPIFKGGRYGKLTLYVTRKGYFPIRIDFHDRDGAIFKFLTVSKMQKVDGKIIPVRYDMMDIRKGTVSIMSFFSFNKNVKFNKELFRSEKLGG